MPLTAYGADKRGSELHAGAAAIVHGVPSVGFRFFNVYGPRQDPHSPYSGVISIFTETLAAGRPVNVYGDGRQTRDFVFVGDIVAFLRAGMEALRSGDLPAAPVLNACTGRETSVLDLARTIGSLVGCEPTVRHAAPRPGDIERSVGCPELAADMLGVRATTELRDGLRATLTGLQGKTSLLPA